MITIYIKSKTYGVKGIHIDAKDFALVNKYKWHIRKTAADTFYLFTQKNHRIYKLHRLILNCPKKLVVDHIDGNSLNNTRRNLRICTQSENTRNRRINKNNKSGYKGVSYHKQTNSWQVEIQYDNKRIYGKTYKDKKDAALAYNKLAIEHHGKFAKLNIID